MGTLLTILTAGGPILKLLAKVAESKLGPKTGPMKKEWLMGIVLMILDKILAGTGIAVNQDLVSRAIDDVVAEMNKNGELSGVTASIPGLGAGTLTFTGTLEVKK